MINSGISILRISYQFLSTNFDSAGVAFSDSHSERKATR